jgi:histidine triad (HIT) family protein
MSDDCLFCRIVAGDIPSTRLHDDALVIAIRDIDPQAPTHVLVLPKAHIASAAHLTDADGPLLARLFGVSAALARQEGLDQPCRHLVVEQHEVTPGRREKWPPDWTA